MAEDRKVITLKELLKDLSPETQAIIGKHVKKASDGIFLSWRSMWHTDLQALRLASVPDRLATKEE